MMTAQQGVYLKSAGMMQRPPYIKGGWRNEDIAVYTDKELMDWLMDQGYVLVFSKENARFFKEGVEASARRIRHSDITDALVDICCLVCDDISKKSDSL